MTRIALSLGGNLGEPIRAMKTALEHLRDRGILTDLTMSSFYRTQPWGGASGDYFYNMVVIAETECDITQLLTACQDEETVAGRVRNTVRYAARTLDIDILLFGDETISSEDVIIPHPRMHERRFVLEPLAEIAGNWYLPQFGCSVVELLYKCPDVLAVARIV